MGFFIVHIVTFQCTITYKYYNQLNYKIMAQFKVVMEITVGAETPLEAAKTIQEWLQDPQSNWQYYVQKVGEKTVDSIDLDEDDEDAVLPVENYEPMIRTK